MENNSYSFKVEQLVNTFSADPSLIAFAQLCCDSSWNSRYDTNFQEFCSQVLFECVSKDQPALLQVYLSLYTIVESMWEQVKSGHLVFRDSLFLSSLKVLVDAECTHDGSIRHIQKYEFWGWKTLQRRVLDAKRTDNLLNLQLQLLTNGFRLLRVGGSLVYSTCSLTVAQNEGVVEQFLLRNPSAELQQIDVANGWPCRSGRIPKTLRFDPTTSQTSGLFIVKISKLAI